MELLSATTATRTIALHPREYERRKQCWRSIGSSAIVATVPPRMTGGLSRIAVGCTAVGCGRDGTNNQGYACRVYWTDPVSMASREFSIFANARPLIEQTCVQASEDCVYEVRNRGVVSKNQESLPWIHWDILEKAMDPIGRKFTKVIPWCTSLSATSRLTGGKPNSLI